MQTGDTSGGRADQAAAPIRVFLVDDQELVRTGFAMVIGSQPDMTVVGEAGNGAEALDRLRVTAADVVIMDVQMPRMDGVTATRMLTQRAKASGGGPRVIVLTTFDLDEHAFSALRAGAAGFLLKDTPPAHLLAAIRDVHGGDAVVAPSTTRRLIERYVEEVPDHEAPDPAGIADLTEREREVLLEIAQGLSNSEIAAKFFLSEATVKTHVGRILGKTGLRDRVALVVLAYRTGLVKPH
ncbi:DNA-binding NarL/FixJ family response regulator [Friedmanniella endophytica]|uniref:DNA-binding NarL/FixJ family response regulator n=1 Tax=Microlunatus kandeliicorticis TaxID=1759536 RepID=A0A7W3P7G5_9ACTN|nr:response regulator transcription factor [Microlunatus kandeliicorticis]MBA8796003.1 DNA-binding NarL/FixJ family response regulator [Microlunatus kandeliicorticis]